MKKTEKQLTPEQYHVTQCGGTEPPFRNEFWNHKEAGIYVDIVSGEALFCSVHKFDSGTGWPSFTQPIEKNAVVEKSDQSHGMTRVEVKSLKGDSHLGHVFEDGPDAETGSLRYCINSAALRFVPVERLEAEGYSEYLSLFDKSPFKSKKEIAILAGGCFWGVEELFRQFPGVLETAVGYTGGSIENPNYQQVKKGTTGHAEAIQITFDPTLLNYADLLRYFFKLHDPTTVNRQGNDIGSQYRSAVFYTSEEQKKTALEIKAEVTRSKKWKAELVTEIVAAEKFYPAEEYHQQYLKKNPGGYTCHFVRD